MTETSSDPPDISSQAPSLKDKAYGFFGRSASSRSTSNGGSILPVIEPRTLNRANASTDNAGYNSSSGANGASSASASLNAVTVGHDEEHSSDFRKASVHGPAADTHPQDAGSGSVIGTEGNPDNPNNEKGDENSPSSKRSTFIKDMRMTFWVIITHSWVNVLLIFVPVGIAVSQIDGISGGVVFALNAVAIVPLAGLLSHATESVARKMGDSLGALLNVTFGNAVELIIFIALVKNQIRIVQASLLGSILANLLLILGMGFFMGGLRYREQLYNSTVTQMSACLLSLSVISLVLPTAFHASFSDSHKADTESLKVSRGTSVILLLVYVIYLLFQLKSHAYLYESTPQHIVDRESTPGPAAAWLDSSSSDDSSSSSSDSDSSSNTVRRKMKKVLRGGRRRKSSVASQDTTELKALRASSIGTNNASPGEEAVSEASSSRPQFPSAPSVEDQDNSDDNKSYRHRKKHSKARKGKDKSKSKKHRKQRSSDGANAEPTINEKPENPPDLLTNDSDTRRVDFAIQTGGEPATPSAGPPKRPFPTLRGVSVKNVKNLAPTVFVKPPEPGTEVTPARPGNVPRVRYGIRRTNSLPDRLNTHQPLQYRAPGAMLSARGAARALADDAGLPGGNNKEDEDDDEAFHLSQTASIALLLISTALVAVCAEFLVDSIQEVTETSSIGEIFIGLIILPIVGNAAEHVTALTVAMKNKMDLAIGVAVGSSIQIAIFVTPLVVILGWIMDKDMSLYFTLFETVCLFVSAFMVNFLVLDGRSNYLEGALLCAVYIIIAIVAFFYPEGEDASQWGQ